LIEVFTANPVTKLPFFHHVSGTDRLSIAVVFAVFDEVAARVPAGFPSDMLSPFP